MLLNDNTEFVNVCFSISRYLFRLSSSSNDGGSALLNFDKSKVIV